MNSPPRSPITALVHRLLPRLRYPYLFLALAMLLAVDLLVPDPIPLVDEAALALLTFLVGTWGSRREDDTSEPVDVTPKSEDDDSHTLLK
jgi:hypothetical protein